MTDTDNLVAVCNFILEERPYTAEALTNELFMYVNFLESVGNYDMKISFEFKDGVLTQSNLPFKSNEVLEGELTSGGEVIKVKKGTKTYHLLVTYRNMKNSTVGV